DNGGDGQFDAQALAERQCGAGTAYALGGHAAGKDVVQLAAFTDGQAHLAVARQRTRGGEHQVAKARQALNGLRLAAQRAGESLDLGQAASDQGGTCVGAEPQAIGYPASNGHDVFQCTADLYPDNILAGVDAAMPPM